MAEIEKISQSVDNSPNSRNKSTKRRLSIASIVLILLFLIVLVYSGWRIESGVRAVRVIQEQNSELQNEVDGLKERLEITAGQLDLTLNALDFANIQVEESQKTLRHYESQLDEAREKLENLQVKSEDDRQQIESLERQLSDAYTAISQLKKALNESSIFQESKYQGEIAQVLENLTSTNPNQAVVLAFITKDLDGSEWNYLGTNISDGFDSPGLAAYILTECGLVDEQTTYVRDHFDDILSTTDEPQIGDLIHYRDGYYMFFYLDEQGQPFVAGMTPLGVRLINYNFSEDEHIYHLDYSTQLVCGT